MSSAHRECPDPEHWTCAVCLKSHVERLDVLLAKEVERTGKHVSTPLERARAAAGVRGISIQQ